MSSRERTTTTKAVPTNEEKAKLFGTMIAYAQGGALQILHNV
jgi:hypothetical protein